MITVEEARRIVMDHVVRLPLDMVPLEASAGRYCATPVVAPVDHPLFDMSAVDGYAFAFDEGVTDRKVAGRIPAGHVLDRPLERGECVRIFTGAMLPPGADTVVMQEHAVRTSDRMAHTDQRLRKGSNVRWKGEQAQAGDRLLDAGDALSPAAIGLLASFGVRSVDVSAIPRVGVVITGGEFTSGAVPEAGRIFSSNDRMLAAALGQGGVPCTLRQVPDDADALMEHLREMAVAHDVVLSTGGASVGEHDLLQAVLQRMGATIHFHGVAQKPGKPMLFATFHGRPFFGLPGNPRAVMVLCWEYVLPFLRAMQGATRPGPRAERLPLTHAVRVKGERAEFRAAQVHDGRVILSADEGSHMLRSLVDADALVLLPADRHAWDAGEPVDVHFLPR